MGHGLAAWGMGLWHGAWACGMGRGVVDRPSNVEGVKHSAGPVGASPVWGVPAGECHTGSSAKGRGGRGAPGAGGVGWCRGPSRKMSVRGVAVADGGRGSSTGEPGVVGAGGGRRRTPGAGGKSAPPHTHTHTRTRTCRHAHATHTVPSWRTHSSNAPTPPSPNHHAMPCACPGKDAAPPPTTPTALPASAVP